MAKALRTSQKAAMDCVMSRYAMIVEVIPEMYHTHDSLILQKHQHQIQ
ncbi:MAG: hypothetical protein K2K05_05430 [Muribaculaceae bacterium]|nr:hypothetical protein [Muribaculaceae bacterium]